MKANLSILQINDIHGYMQPHPEMVRDAGEWHFTRLGGLARIASMFDQVRREMPGAVIALDNGDTFHGTRAAVETKGFALVPAMSALKLDAMTVHWEFAYGPEGVEKLAAALPYPMLATNIHRTADDSLFLPPYTMIERAGLRIAIIGLACPIVDKTMPPKFSAGLRFGIGNDTLPMWIERVRNEEGAKLVIVLSHLGFPQDVRLARETDGIDVLVSGHTHNRMREAIVENGAIIFQSGCHGSFVGRLDLCIEDGRVASHRHRLMPVDETLPEDATVAGLVDQALQPFRAGMQTIVGRTATALHRYAMLSTPMDDLLLEAIARAAGTDIAFSNGWRYGAPIPPGPVTLDDLWNIIPANPPVLTVRMTGAEIRDMLEQNLERTFAADPYEQMGGYIKRMRGITMYFKAENPAHRRIDRLFANGSPLDDAAEHVVAYVTSQGVPARYGTDRRTLPIDAVTAMKRLFESVAAVALSGKQTVFEI